MSEVTIGTWNIEFGRRVDEALVITQRDPGLRAVDVWLLQEMDEPGTEQFAAGLGFQYVYGYRDVHPQSGRPFGNAVVSRYPLGHREVIELPSTAVVAGTPRLMVGAEVDVPGLGFMNVYSVHAELPFMAPGQRRRHLEQIAAAAPDHRPMVVGGDFNTATRRGRDKLYRLMEGYGASSAVNDDIITLVRFGVGLQLDHELVRDCESVAAGSPGITHASDHAPLWVRIGASTAPSGQPT